MTSNRKSILPKLFNLFIECVHCKKCIGFSPERRIYALFYVPKSLECFCIFIKCSETPRDSGFNFLSATCMMYVSFMRPSLVFMYRPHVCSAVHPLAQWLLVV